MNRLQAEPPQELRGLLEPHSRSKGVGRRWSRRHSRRDGRGGRGLTILENTPCASQVIVGTRSSHPGSNNDPHPRSKVPKKLPRKVPDCPTPAVLNTRKQLFTPHFLTAPVPPSSPFVPPSSTAPRASVASAPGAGGRRATPPGRSSVESTAPCRRWSRPSRCSLGRRSAPRVARADHEGSVEWGRLHGVGWGR